MNSDQSLIRFAEQFLSRQVHQCRAGEASVESQDSVVHYTLFRENEFQVEQYVIVGRDIEYPPHSHPNVETIEFRLCGDLLFYVEGQPCEHNTTLTLELDGEQRLENVVRIHAGQEHWLKVGSTGGAFLSIQRWLNRRPTSVVLDWDGPAFSDTHESNVVNLKNQEEKK